MVHHFDRQPGFGHLAGNDLHLFLPGKQRKDGGGNLQVVDAPITIRQKGAGNTAIAIVHAADHVALVTVTKPGVDVGRQQFRLLRTHSIVVFCGDIQCGAHLTMEEVGRTENLLRSGIQVCNSKCLTVIIQME